MWTTHVTAPKDLGDASYILGLEIYLPASTFSQMAHTHKTLMRYGMSESLPVATSLDPIRKAEPGTEIADSSEYQTTIGSSMCPIWPSQSHSRHNSSLDRTKDTCDAPSECFGIYPAQLTGHCTTHSHFYAGASYANSQALLRMHQWSALEYMAMSLASQHPTRLRHGLQLLRYCINLKPSTISTTFSATIREHWGPRITDVHYHYNSRTATSTYLRRMASQTYSRHLELASVTVTKNKPKEVSVSVPLISSPASIHVLSTPLLLNI